MGKLYRIYGAFHGAFSKIFGAFWRFLTRILALWPKKIWQPWHATFPKMSFFAKFRNTWKFRKSFVLYSTGNLSMKVTFPGFNQFHAIFLPFPRGYRKGLTQNWKKIEISRLTARNFKLFFQFFVSPFLYPCGNGAKMAGNWLNHLEKWLFILWLPLE